MPLLHCTYTNSTNSVHFCETQQTTPNDTGDNTKLLFMLGLESLMMAHYLKNDFKKAWEYGEQLKSIDSHHQPAFWWSLMTIAMSLGREEEALDCLLHIEDERLMRSLPYGCLPFRNWGLCVVHIRINKTVIDSIKDTKRQYHTGHEAHAFCCPPSAGGDRLQ